MGRKLELTTLEIAVAREAMQEYIGKAYITATEYEAKEAKGERYYGQPLINPRLIVTTAQHVLEALDSAMNKHPDEKDFHLGT